MNKTYTSKLKENRDGTMSITVRVRRDIVWLLRRDFQAFLDLSLFWTGCVVERSYVGSVNALAQADNTYRFCNDPEGVPGNMDPTTKRLRGWRGTTDDWATYALGWRTLIEKKQTVYANTVKYFLKFSEAFDPCTPKNAYTPDKTEVALAELVEKLYEVPATKVIQVLQNTCTTRFNTLPMLAALVLAEGSKRVGESALTDEETLAVSKATQDYLNYANTAN